MTITLIKGQKVDLTKTNPLLKSVIVGMGWEAVPDVDIDFSSFLLAGNAKVTQDSDLIFYGNPAGPNQCVSVRSQAVNLAGILDKAQLEIHFKNIPDQYERISFSLTIYDGEQRSQSFAKVRNTYIRIMDPASNQEIIRFNIDTPFSVETAIVVGEIYKHQGEWKFNSIASGFSGGLEALCSSYGIEVQEESVSSPTPEPPKSTPLPPTPAPPPVNLSKIELKKRGDKINLQKGAGPLGEIVVNLNWSQGKKDLFGSAKRIDLDLGCLFELQDGYKGVIQALGKRFGSLDYEPYIALDGDDRTGLVKTGENLRINGKYLSEIKRILVFAYIYDGVANWAQADGVVTIKQSGGPDIEVRLDEHNDRQVMCGIALITNENNQTFSVEKLIHYTSGHKELDRAFDWNMRWTTASK
ncbi:TerD domain-containing protein [Paenibacillus sp. P96]|uniref:TerD domain-containing protein n=1 Tax=Paenibacillus zeirhizosphaerae TaxID=2987519 RepID=A0ABT9FUA8_9BACL|nr:TerD family protein [Paenibacillus sp. P96]MDP4098052.1 TerD domain-containing protein [Paenibacillus sp. P96]